MIVFSIFELLLLAQCIHLADFHEGGSRRFVPLSQHSITNDKIINKNISRRLRTIIKSSTDSAKCRQLYHVLSLATICKELHESMAFVPFNKLTKFLVVELYKVILLQS